MRRFLIAALMAFLAASPAIRAQDTETPLRPGYDTPDDGESLEFEVVSVMRQNLMVVARDLESGDEFRFRIPPNAFRGQEFTANLAASEAGRKVSVRGTRNARLEELELEAPLGLSRSGDQRGGMGRPEGGRGFERPSQWSARPPGGKSRDRYQLDRTESRGGGDMKYRVESFDPTTWIATARGADGSQVRLQIDPQAFEGFRFRAPVRRLRKGQGFALLALNQEPIENCCTVVRDGGPR